MRTEQQTLERLLIIYHINSQTYQKPNNMLRIPQDHKNGIPQSRPPWIFPAVQPAYIHEPRVPRLGRHDQAFDVP